MSLEDIGRAETICGEDLRVGIFFDGTGNNLFNDTRDLRELKIEDLQEPDDRSESEKKAAAKDAPLVNFNSTRSNESEREDKRSNIAKLRDLYKTEEDEVYKGKKYSRKRKNIRIYKEGIGTSAGEDDSGWNQGTGNGGAKRINQAVKDIEKILNKHPAKEFNRWIDVFGFSRGAAIARDFINTLYQTNRHTSFDVGFVGLFDTVASFGVGGNNTNMKPKDSDRHTEAGYVGWDKIDKGTWGTLRRWFGKKSYVDEYYVPYNLNLHSNSAHMIVHMTALDEIRYTFPLSGLSLVDKVHHEWKFLGVHSDIGGGYTGKFQNSEVDFLKLVQTNRYLSNQNGKMLAFIEQANAAGYYVEVVPFRHNAIIGVIYYRVRVYTQRIVQPDLAKICLRIMHSKAKDFGVPLKPIDESDKDYKIPDDLKAYYKHASALPADAANYAAQDLDERKKIYHKYVHRSHGKSFQADGFMKRAAMFPRRKNWWRPGVYQRQVFDNEPNKAITRYQN